MEEIVKMEDTSTSSGGGDDGGFFPFSDNSIANPNSFLDFSDGDEKWSVGFTELLGLEFKDYCSEVLNPPATPNSSSVSSASSDDHAAAADQHNPNKQLKAKKKKEKKKEKEARFAFMTKSEVDHLEDGYRWRKYGQKAVKNSPFPRSYYRCTTAACGVKKRVERSFADPTIVVTTYEGQHTHSSPVLTRSALAFALPPPPFTGVAGGLGVAPMPWLKASNNAHDGSIQAMSPQYIQNLAFVTSQHLGVDYNCNLVGAANVAGILQEKRLCNPNPNFLGDHGLLQDVVPPHMLKQE